MWLIFIAVVLVLALLMVFLLISIRLLTAEAKEQLNRYFLKNLETYDRLAENKNARIDELNEELRDLESKVAASEKRLEAMASAGGGSTKRWRSPGERRATDTMNATYRDPAFFDDYAYIRKNMRLDYGRIIKDLMAKLDFSEESQLALYRGILEKLPQEKLYDIVTLGDADLAVFLKQILNEEEWKCLHAYVEETGSFDLLAFHSYLSNYVKDHENELYIRTGNPDEWKQYEGKHVHVLYDAGIHEGIRISFKDTVYDYSL
jgi:hypothetical protein